MALLASGEQGSVLLSVFLKILPGAVQAVYS